jgi:hypothetical protein
MPEDRPTVAIPVLLLLQVPPVTALLKVVVEPAHTVVVPVIAEGVVLTDRIAVEAQPFVSV